MLDFSDCRAHLFNADLTDQHWNWAISNGGQDTQYAASVVHFRAGFAGP